MSIRVDAALWRAFERAAALEQRVPDDLIRAFMGAYADGLGSPAAPQDPLLSYEAPGYAGSDRVAFGRDQSVPALADDQRTIDGQIDLEDYLRTSR